MRPKTVHVKRRPLLGAGRGAGGGKTPTAKKQKDSLDEQKRKWLHHRLKVLRKVLKKVKTFEVLKIQRRAAQAKDAAGKGEGAPASARVTAIDPLKLQAQLAAAKAVDLDEVAKRAMERCGLMEATSAPLEAAGSTAPTPGSTGPMAGSTAPTAGPAAPTTGSRTPAARSPGPAAGSAGSVPAEVLKQPAEDSKRPAEAPNQPGPLEIVRDRLLRAGAVRKELLLIVADFNKRFKTVHEAPAEGQESEEEEEGVKEEEDNDDSLAEGKAEVEDSEGGDSPASLSHDPDEAGPAGDGPDAAEPSAEAQAVLSTLINKLKLLRDDAKAQASLAQGEDSEDSGVIDSDLDMGDEPGSCDLDNDAGAANEAGPLSEEGEQEEEEEGDGESEDSRQWDAPAAGPGGGGDEDEAACSDSRADGDSDAEAGTEVADSKATASKKTVGPRADVDKGKGAATRDGKAASLAPTGGKQAGKEATGKGPKAAPDKGPKAAPDKKAQAGKKSNYDPRKDDPLLNKKNKNRLGQHARQRLAEQMFGREAKHLQMMKDKKAKADSLAQQPAEHLHPSWAAKRKQSGAIPSLTAAAAKKTKFDDDGASAAPPAHSGASAGDRRQGQGRPGGAGGARPVQPRGAAFTPAAAATGKPLGVPAKRKKIDEGPLHPSWEAHKKSRAAAAAAAAVPAAPTGKKTVFAD